MKKKVVRDTVVSTLMENGPQTHVEKKVEWVPAKAVRDLLIVCKQLAIDIIALQETKLTPNSNFRLQGYSIVRKDRSGRGGGVLIAIKENINYDRVTVEINSEVPVKDT
uniref:Endonuclease/exonuclease/phosphatase domain-containing protein n=1 Tax=Phlebotomus papatasi TaxID=29031 RepID=A0A1B0GNP6_PHLPP